MPKILIIDDDTALTTVFETALTNQNFVVSVAPDGETGLEKAKQEKPDVILLDQILTDMSGNDILKKLKEDEETKQIPVAMLSNFGQNELVEEALKTGATVYILKYQIDANDLVKKVKEILS